MLGELIKAGRVKSRVADPGGVDPDLDLTLGKKIIVPDPTLKQQTGSPSRSDLMKFNSRGNLKSGCLDRFGN